MSQLDKWMVGGKISKLVIVITDKDTGEHVERWQFDVHIFNTSKSKKSKSSSNQENDAPPSASNTASPDPSKTEAEIQAELERVAATPQVKFTDITGDTSTASPASPLKPEFISVFEKGARKAWGDVPIIPMQSSGASDSMWFRAVGVPSYGASASMSKDSDDFSHGLNERISLENLGPGVVYYLSVMTDLASK